MQRKRLQAGVVYAYGYDPEGIGATPIVLLSATQLYQSTYDPDEKFKPAPPDRDLSHGGRRMSEVGYPALQLKLDTPTGYLAEIDITVELARFSRRDTDHEPGIPAIRFLVTKPGYINGPWAVKASEYEASRELQRSRAAANHARSVALAAEHQERRRQGTEAAQRLTEAGYGAKFAMGAIQIDVEAAVRLAADIKGLLVTPQGQDPLA